MTVVIGMVCSDGVLIATDSQATSGRVAQPMTKARTIRGAATVWSSAGALYVMEEVEAVLADKVENHLLNEGSNKWKRMFSEPDLRAIRTEFADIVRQTMLSCYQAALPGVIPPGVLAPGQHLFATDFLFSGMGGDAKFLLEIASDGQLNWHTDKGFIAIGSGSEFATVAMELMKPYMEEGPLDLELGQIVAYRTIDTTCDVSAGLVRGPVQMAIADANGSRVLNRQELYDIEESVQRWKASERDLLLSLSDGASSEDSIDLPDSLST